MGHGSWSPARYTATSSTHRSKSVDHIYTSTSAKHEQRAVNIEFRESRDSEDNPKSLPIIIGLDVTGSMGYVLEDIAKDSLGSLMGELTSGVFDFNAHVMFNAIGDATVHDRYPLQATQFEADNRVHQQLLDLYFERGGGGNRFESYDLAWSFAALKTRSDAWDKRQKRGYLFTIGDEEFPGKISTEYYQKVFGQSSIDSPGEALTQAINRYHVYHIITLEGSHAQLNRERTVNSWLQVMGNRTLPMENHKHVSAIISAAISINEGADPEATVKRFNNADVQESVRTALGVGVVSQGL